MYLQTLLLWLVVCGMCDDVPVHDSTDAHNHANEAQSHGADVFTQKTCKIHAYIAQQKAVSVNATQKLGIDHTRVAHETVQLIGSSECNYTGVWFRSSLPTAIAVKHDTVSSEEESKQSPTAPEHFGDALHHMGHVKCDDAICIPPFWAWWSEIRAHCVLEWIGARAQRDADRAPWESGVTWNATLGVLDAQIEDSYLQHEGSPRVHIWHCRTYPRVYRAVSMTCPVTREPQQRLRALEQTTVPTDEMHGDGDVQLLEYAFHADQCYINVQVGLGVRILLYGFSALVVGLLCVCYLTCMYMCMTWCSQFALCDCCLAWCGCRRKTRRLDDDDDEYPEDNGGGVRGVSSDQSDGYSRHQTTRTRKQFYRNNSGNNHHHHQQPHQPQDSRRKNNNPWDKVSGKTSMFNKVFSMMSRSNIFSPPTTSGAYQV